MQYIARELLEDAMTECRQAMHEGAESAAAKTVALQNETPGIQYVPGYLNQITADTMFQDLHNGVDWQQTYYNFNNRKVAAPRLVALVGESNYTYSGLSLQPDPWPTTVKILLPALLKKTGIQYNGALLNLYRNGKDSVGFHSDNEPELGESPTIASISLGATRIMTFKHKRTGAIKRFALSHGDLLVMSGNCQNDWLHAIEKTTNDVDARINITFRAFIPEPTTEETEMPDEPVKLNGLGVITVVNRHHPKTGNKFIYGGRGTPLGNPYYEADRNENIERFIPYFESEMRKHHSPTYREVYRLVRLIKSGIPVDIACSCKPKPCHLDVVKDTVERIANRTIPYTVTIVGSRETPVHILEYTKKLTASLQALGVRIRTGDAAGMDASARTTNTLLQVFKADHAQGDSAAHALASKYHPAWQFLKNEYVQNLHARNAYQVLGMSLNSPSDALVCYTPDGCTEHAQRSRKTGGTGTAISIASENGVPVFNLANKGSVAAFYALLESAGVIDENH